MQRAPIPGRALPSKNFNVLHLWHGVCVAFEREAKLSRVARTPGKKAKAYEKTKASGGNVWDWEQRNPGAQGTAQTTTRIAPRASTGSADS
jgi:hypothetical protein